MKSNKTDIIPGSIILNGIKPTTTQYLIDVLDLDELTFPIDCTHITDKDGNGKYSQFGNHPIVHCPFYKFDELSTKWFDIETVGFEV
jgi:hypothetical protein